MRKSIIFFLIGMLSVSTLFAEVKPSTLFAEHMVLQRGVEIPVWGTAWPNEVITVSLNKKVVGVKADANGNWMVKLPKQKWQIPR
jgi:sialate O-acetylesterase